MAGQDIIEKVEEGEEQKIYTYANANIRSRGDSIYLKYITNLRRKKAQGGGGRHNLFAGASR